MFVSRGKYFFPERLVAQGELGVLWKIYIPLWYEWIYIPSWYLRKELRYAMFYLVHTDCSPPPPCLQI